MLTEVSPSSSRNSDYLRMQNIAAGDRGAFEKLVSEFQPAIQRYLGQRFADVGLVEEIANDVLLQVWQSAKTYAGHAKLSTWIIAITRNCACNALRGKRIELTYREPSQLDTHADKDNQDPPATRHDQTRIAAQLHTAIGRLSLEQRSVIELSYFQGCRYHEIAAIMDCPMNTVKTRVYHAKQQLHYLLDGSSRAQHQHIAFAA